MNNFGRGKKNHFQNLISVPGIYFFLLKNIFQQKKFIQKNLEVHLPSLNDCDGSITEKDLQKIRSYYAVGVPGVLGASLAVLRGFHLNHNERTCLTFLGGISGMLDDLFDDPEKEAEHLKDFILHPYNAEGLISFENLLLDLYQKGLSCSPDAEQLKLQALEVFEAQRQSVLQNSETSQSFLRDITFKKGGSSFIFYRLCMQHHMDEPEKNLLFQMGGLMQLGNDIFDVWEDFHSGINTVATSSENMDNLRKIFTQELDLIFPLAYKTSYPEENIREFLQITLLALSRVYVCLDQFKKLQIASGKKFLPGQYERKQLICDMQKPSNQFKAIKYYLSIL